MMTIRIMLWTLAALAVLGTGAWALDFTAADFNVTGGGTVALDYANGTAATDAAKGFETAADHKLASFTAATAIKLAGGGL